MKKYLSLLITLLFLSNLFASDISSLAKVLNIYPGTKASIQWERIFSSERRLKKYTLDTLEPYQLLELKEYLIKHAADSKQPIVPGL